MTGCIRFACSSSQGGVTFCLAVKNDGVYAWGYNGYGQLGDGTTDNITTGPVKTLAGSFDRVVCGCSQNDDSYNMSFAIGGDGTMYVCGYNGYGNLGLPAGSQHDAEYQKVWRQSATNVVDAWCHGWGTRLTSYYLSNAGYLHVAGNNQYGQWGNGTTGDSKVAGWRFSGGGLKYKDFSVAGTNEMSCIGLCTDGTVRTWGGNNYGQLGSNNTTQKNSVHNPSLAGIKKVRMHDRYVMTGALSEDGKLYMCGYNAYGQMGRDYTGDQLAFNQVLLDGADMKIKDFEFWGEDSGTGVTVVDQDDVLYSCGYAGQYNTAIGGADGQNEHTVLAECNIHCF